MTLNVDVKMGQRANLQVTPTHKGRTVPVDGPVQWSSDDANVVAVTPSADGLACVARPTGVGTVDVVATADAKIGEGVNPQRTTFHFTVREAEASELVGAVVSVEDDA